MTPTTEQKVAALHTEHPEWGRYKIAQVLGIANSAAGKCLARAKQAHGGSAPTAKQATESFEDNGDTATAMTLNPRIKTLDDLLKHMKVDLSVWQVERHIVNKWEVGINNEGAIKTEPLFQVKAWLVRKCVEVQALQGLLAQITAKARPVVKSPRRLAPRPPNGSRSLEVCLMDIHMGLLCQYPEADARWSPEIAAATVMRGVEDLIALTRQFGPFDEIFLPFGNDFSHVDNIFHTTTAGTAQPEAISWHRMYIEAEALAIQIVERLRQEVPSVKIYEIPGNHSRMADFTLARVLKAYFRSQSDVTVDASASPYKFHRCGVNLIGYEHGHSVKPSTLVGLMANERRQDWAETHFREWHLGDKHRKGGVTFEEQGVSIEYVPGITAGNEWHRLKAFNHCTRGAMAYVWDWKRGPLFRCQHNISQYLNQQ